MKTPTMTIEELTTNISRSLCGQVTPSRVEVILELLTLESDHKVVAKKTKVSTYIVSAIAEETKRIQAAGRR